MDQQLRRWFLGRHFVIVANNAFVSLDFLGATSVMAVSSLQAKLNTCFRICKGISYGR
jgi:hypothetical protein